MNDCVARDTGVAAGSYGGASDIPVVYIGEDGRIRSATTIAVVIPPAIIGSALNSGQIIVGSASNLSAAAAVSGDMTLSNTGATTLASVGPGVTTAQRSAVTIDAKGRVTALDNGFYLFIYHTAATAWGTVIDTMIKYDTITSTAGAAGLTYTVASGLFACTVSGSYRVFLSLRAVSGNAEIKFCNNADNVSLVSCLCSNGLMNRTPGIVSLVAGQNYAVKIARTNATTFVNTTEYANSFYIRRES